MLSDSSVRPPASEPRKGGKCGPQWNGTYAAAFAQRGQTLYRENCARCHGQDLSGGEDSPALGPRPYADTVAYILPVNRFRGGAGEPGTAAPPAPVPEPRPARRNGANGEAMRAAPSTPRSARSMPRMWGACTSRGRGRRRTTASGPSSTGKPRLYFIAGARRGGGEPEQSVRCSCCHSSTPSDAFSEKKGSTGPRS